MIVYFDPATLAPTHVVSAHDASYDPACNGEHHVVLPPGVGLAHEHIHLALDDDGEVAVRVRRASPIVLPAPTIDLGENARFTRVAVGTAVTVNGVTQGTMDDASGLLEVSPRTPGFFTFLFAKPGWMDVHFVLEVLPPPAPEPPAAALPAPAEDAA